MVTSSETSGSGTTWERYRLEGLLGRGAGGSVHRALDLWTGERVAVKRYRSGVSASAAHEASLLSEIRFPGVVRLKDCTTDVGGSFLAVFEYLRGEDLRSAAEGRSVVDVAPLFADVLRALAFVHRRGIVHRDLKPENVIVSDRDGVARATVIDFGLASDRRDPAASVGGTLAYLAPEVLEGGAPDARSDLYGLGILLYEVLSGRRPSAGLSGVDVVRLHTTRDLRRAPAVARNHPAGRPAGVRT
ncbi:MAG: serine/threonine-protein kinase, partial [Planctomycetota bacterium JB042]